MKSAFLIATVVLAPAALIFAQAQTGRQSNVEGQSTVLGRGRGGAPFAWNDKDKDGICDVTGRPVSEGRPVGFGRGRGRGGANAFGDRNRDGVCDFTGRPVGRGRNASAGGWGGRGWGRRAWSAAAAVPVQPQNPTARTPAQTNQ